MPAEFEIRNEAKLKNKILSCFKPAIEGFIDVSTIGEIKRQTRIDSDTLEVLLQRMGVDGYISIEAPIETMEGPQKPYDNYIVHRTTEGNVFFKNGGYSSSSLKILYRKVKANIIPTLIATIGTIMVGVLTALILKYYFHIS